MCSICIVATTVEPLQDKYYWGSNNYVSLTKRCPLFKGFLIFYTIAGAKDQYTLIEHPPIFYSVVDILTVVATGSCIYNSS